MKKWLATMITCLMLLLVSSGAALAHDNRDYRHAPQRHHFRNHHFDHHRHWRHHDGRIIIRANLDDNVTVIWDAPLN